MDYQSIFSPRSLANKNEGTLFFLVVVLVIFDPPLNIGHDRSHVKEDLSVKCLYIANDDNFQFVFAMDNVFFKNFCIKKTDDRTRRCKYFFPVYSSNESSRKTHTRALIFANFNGPYFSRLAS